METACFYGEFEDVELVRLRGEAAGRGEMLCFFFFFGCAES